MAQGKSRLCFVQRQKQKRKTRQGQQLISFLKSIVCSPKNNKTNVITTIERIRACTTMAREVFEAKVSTSYSRYVSDVRSKFEVLKKRTRLRMKSCCIQKHTADDTAAPHQNLSKSTTATNSGRLVTKQIPHGSPCSFASCVGSGPLRCRCCSAVAGSPFKEPCDVLLALIVVNSGLQHDSGRLHRFPFSRGSLRGATC